MKICRINTLSPFQDKRLQNSSKEKNNLPVTGRSLGETQHRQAESCWVSPKLHSNISFKGISEDIIGKSTDERLQLPYKMIKITDPNPENKGCTYEFCTDEPYREFLQENLAKVLSSSSHFHKNSKIEKVRELETIPLEHEPVPPSRCKVVRGNKKSSQKTTEKKEVKEVKDEFVYKESFDCRKFDYRGKIYFEDMDEVCTPEIYAASNIIVHDRRPGTPGFRQIKYSYYFDTKSPRRAASGNEDASDYKASLEAVEDYSLRKIQNCLEKINAPDTEQKDAVFATERIKRLQKSAKFARTVLNNLNRIDAVIAKRDVIEAQLKDLQKSENNVDKEALSKILSAEIEKANELISRQFSHLGTYYKNNL